MTVLSIGFIAGRKVYSRFFRRKFMTIKDRFLRFVNIFFVLLLLVQLLPNRIEGEAKTIYTVVFTLIIEAVVILISAFSKEKNP